ncbi:putative type II secretion system protein HxcR [compost metagenome]
MGVEPFLLSSSLLGVLAQRLVRKLCVHCRERDEQGHWRAVGCERCNHVGYKGRTGIYELLVCDDPMRSLIHNRAAESELIATAQAAGLRSMREDGQHLVDAGITSAAEVISVTRD